MGDKSPKAKQKGMKQKDVARAGSAADAKSKQDGYARPQQPAFKGRK